MCGICGVVQLRGASRTAIEPTTLDRMTDAMTHRGPDDRGTYTGEGIALGVRRLSIVDVQGGHQPFANEDGRIWAVQNGELYNHAEIRRELGRMGHRFASRCDTEILPHVYEQVGSRAPEWLRGKFALAVWDESRRQLLLARDRLGVKPLYYAVAGEHLVFASELKSLLASGLVATDLDVEAISAYLALGYVPGPRTLLRDVRKLLPGHRLVASEDGVGVDAYWRYPRPTTERDRRTEDEWAEELLAGLDEAVRLRLMSDVPVGAMLSGGLDSSLVVALMARHAVGPVKTFSVGFAEAGEANELGDARLVADTFGTDHHELRLSLNDAAVDLPDLVWWLDEPVADLSALGLYALCDLASREVTVGLSGQGADELLGGYLKHKAASLCGLVPRPLARAGGLLGARGPVALRRPAATLAAATPAGRVFAMSGKVDAAAWRVLARGELADVGREAALRAIEHHAHGVRADPLAETLYLDAQLALPDDMLHYFDRMSMAHSLELRVPFLDHRVVELCARIPSGMKVRRLASKHVLKRAARGVVPDQIIDKRKIGFFRDSTDLWFSQHARGAISDWLLGGRPRYAEFLDPRGVAGLVSAYLAGDRRANVHLLLAILMLEIWLAEFLPRATSDTGSPVVQSARL